MQLINLVVLMMPIIGTLGGLWVNCALIDSVPVNAFKEQRHQLRYGLLFLFAVILAVLVFGYQSVEMIKTQYIFPV